MKRKTVGGILIAVAAVILVAVILLAESFYGSLTMRVITTEKVKRYVAENYPEKPYKTQFSRYDFKCGGYFCIVQSTESPDTRFTVYASNEKNGIRDDYKTMVTGRENTAYRLERELDAYADRLIGQSFLHRTSLVLCCRDENVTEQQVAALELDQKFDAPRFPLPTTLTVWVETENQQPTWEELAERLRELELLTREKLPHLTTFSVCVQNPYIEEGGEWVPGDHAGEICAYNVPKEVITGNGLTEYLAGVRAEQEAEQLAIANGQEIKESIE